MKKFKLDYLHLADGESIDQRGKLSIYGIFEKVNLKKSQVNCLNLLSLVAFFLKKALGKI